MVSGAKEDAEKVFRPDFCALRGSGSGGGGGALVLLLPVNRVHQNHPKIFRPWNQIFFLFSGFQNRKKTLQMDLQIFYSDGQAAD